MSFTRANAGTWGVGDELTAAQINTVDNNAASALDKRAGQTDTLGSVVTCSGAGRIVPTVVAGADADTTYLAGGGNQVIRVATATGSRVYTLSATGAQTGDVITIVLDSAFPNIHVITVKDQAAATIASMGTIYVASEGRCASFIYHSSGWHIYRSGRDPWAATLDGSSKLSAAQRTNWTVALQKAQISVFNTTSTTYVDVTGFTVTVASAVAGDLLVIDACISAGHTSGSNTGIAKVLVVDPTATQVGPLVTVPASGTSGNAAAQYIGTLWTVVTPGSIVVKVQIQAGATSSAQVSVDSILRVQHIRP